MLLGQNADGQPIYLTPEMRKSTHMHVIGGSGTGKSKFLESILRQDIREGTGFCLIDWHGTLYQDILAYCAQLDVGLYDDFRKIILLNPSHPSFVTGFNPFLTKGVDVSTQVNNRIAATIRPWGITDTNQMPTFERLCRLLYTFAVEEQETLLNVALLIEFGQPEFIDYAIAHISDSHIRDQWKQLKFMTTFRDWREFVLSTENRLGRFLGSTAVKRFMGMPDGNINLREVMDQGHILLVNLGSSGYLDRDSARVFASLFLNEFFETAMVRANEAKLTNTVPNTFVFCLDEFQEYITDDIAGMLDQVRKGGLHMVLSHQHLSHLTQQPTLLHSVLTNARIRAVFGGLPFESSVLLANEMFLPDLNTRQIKKAYWHTNHLHEEQTRLIHSHSTSTGRSSSISESRSNSTGTNSTQGTSASSGAGRSTGASYSAPGQLGGFSPGETEGWFSESEGNSSFSATSSSNIHGASDSRSLTDSESSGNSESHSEGESLVPVWVPIPIQELGSEAEWSLEEKRSKVAEMLKTQQQRHCFIKLDTKKTEPLLVPFVKEYSHTGEYLLEYEHKVFKAQGARPASVVDDLLETNKQRFLNQIQQSTDKATAEFPSSMADELPRDRTRASRRTKPKKPTG